MCSWQDMKGEDGDLRLEEEAAEALVNDGEDVLAGGGGDGHEGHQAEHGDAAYL